MAFVRVDSPITGRWDENLLRYCTSSAVVSVAMVVAIGGFAIAESAAAQGRTETSRAPVLVSIRGADGDYASFGELAAAASGRLAVTQPQDGTVLLFGNDGKLLSKIGRSGEGPGEFKRLDSIGWIEDTLWIADYGNYRLTLVSKSGVMLRSVPLPARVQGGAEFEGSYAPRLMAVFPDGAGLFRVTKPGDVIEGIPGDPRGVETRLIRMAFDGTRPEVIVKLPPDQCQRRTPRTGVILPLCPRPLYAVSPDGGRIAILLMDSDERGTGSYRVTTISSAGDTIFSRQIAARQARVNPSRRDTLAAMIGSKASPATRALAGDYRVPSYYPLVRDISIASDGRVLVGLWPASDAMEREWHALNARAGTVNAKIIPMDKGKFTIEPRGIWIVEEEASGLENLVLHSIPIR